MKFSYLDKVCITEGFFKGHHAVVIHTAKPMFMQRRYLVEVRSFISSNTIWFKEEDLQRRTKSKSR